MDEDERGLGAGIDVSELDQDPGITPLAELFQQVDSPRHVAGDAAPDAVVRRLQVEHCCHQSLALLAFLAGSLFIYWTRFEFRVGEDEIRIDSGIFNRTHRSIPFDRIQDVDISQGPLARLFGIAKVKFETGGSSAGGQDEGVLQAIPLEQATGDVDSGALTRAQQHLSIVHASGAALARAVREVDVRPRIELGRTTGFRVETRRRAVNGFTQRSPSVRTVPDESGAGDGAVTEALPHEVDRPRQPVSAVGPVEQGQLLGLAERALTGADEDAQTLTVTASRSVLPWHRLAHGQPPPSWKATSPPSK